MHSPFGLSLRAIRNNPLRAAATQRIGHPAPDLGGAGEQLDGGLCAHHLLAEQLPGLGERAAGRNAGARRARGGNIRQLTYIEPRPASGLAISATMATGYRLGRLRDFRAPPE